MFATKPRIPAPLLASELAASIPVEELETLERFATPIRVAPGEEIMHADEYGRECFVVVEGEFEVQRGDQPIVLGPGAVVGELSLLTLKPRTATVTARTDATVYVLNRAEFAAVLEQCPNLARHVLEDAVKRAAAS